MPLGASILMRGLGMRGPKKRGTKDPGAYDRPTVFCHDGEYYPVPPEFRGDEQFGIPPYMNDEDTALAIDKYLENPFRSSEGLSKDYVWRLFEFERSKWARQGFISPYKDYRSRVARDDLEFRLWRHWHPRREEIKERENEEYDRLHDLYDDHEHDQEPYRRRRGAVSYKPPPLRRRGLVDHRDPKNCPPYPAYGINEVRRGTHRRTREPFEGRRDRHPRRHSAFRTMQVPRDTRRPLHPAYVPTRGRGRSRVHDGYEARGEEIPAFFPRDLRHHRHGLDFDADEYERDEDARSLPSNQSFIRHPHRRPRPLSPNIIYPHAPPYYGRPLGHSRRHGRHDDDDDDIDAELADELFRGRGAHVGHRRHPFGIGREGGRFRMGRRGHEDEGLEYGFSGDEDEEFDF